MGFTAINATTALKGRSKSGNEGSGTINSRQVRTVTYKYLGRDEDLLPVAVSKKENGKGKKCAASASGLPQNKRRRASSDPNGLSITDEITRIPRDNAADTVAHSQSSEANKSKKDKTTSKESTAWLNSVGILGKEQDLISPGKPVSVYAPTTFMDTVDTTSARTSCDFVKTNVGHSFTCYQSPASSGARSANVRIPQHWSTLATDVGRYSSRKNEVQPARNNDFKLLNCKTSDGRLDGDMDEAPTSEKKDACEKVQPQTISYEEWSVPESVCSDSEHSGDMMIEARLSTRFRKFTPSNTAEATLRHGASSDEFQQCSAAAKSLEVGAWFNGVEDNDLVDIARLMEEDIDRPPTRRRKNTREVDEYEDYGGALLSSEERTLLANFKRPEDTPKPIVRKPFPTSILDRSPIFGASNNSVLRTCFRIGEALNCGSQAVRSGTNIVLELYARVKSSWREERPGRKQHFVFSDLYHDKLPYLEGTFELWDQASLWDHDSKAFLKARGNGGICRLIAKMRRDNQKWRLEVLSIWEADWGDIHYVAGIYGEERPGELR